MKTITVLVLFLTATFAMADGRHERHGYYDDRCGLNEIYDKADETLKLLATSSNDHGGNHGRTNLREEIVKNLQSIKKIARECSHRDERPRPPHKRTCQVYPTDGSRYATMYHKNYSNGDGTTVISLGIGTELEILGDDVFYSEGERKNGVKLRVIRALPGLYEPVATPGMMIWYYKNILDDACR